MLHELFKNASKASLFALGVSYCGLTPDARASSAIHRATRVQTSMAMATEARPMAPRTMTPWTTTARATMTWTKPM